MLDLTNLGAAAKPQSADIKDTDASGFEKDVLQVSLQRPVIVDFWAPWCGPCKQMMPALEKAVADAKGAVALVKVNIDASPELVQAFRVQSVPMVYAFYQGQPVDGFMGAKSPSEIAAFIDKLKVLIGAGANENAQAVPDKEQVAAVMAKALTLFAEDKVEEAMAGYSAVLDIDPENMEALAGIGWCFVAFKDAESLKALLSDATEAQKNHPRLKGLVLLLDKGAQAQPETAKAKTPQDKYDLALRHLARLDLVAAIDALIDLIRQDREWQDQKARKLLLELFDAMGPAHKATREGRRKLSAVLFS